ncbi:MAG: prolipoprotein diacylglyceryl transferase [Acidimicrobiia bacterium]
MADLTTTVPGVQSLLTLSAIPSPANGVLHLGPVPIHMYGVCIAIGVLIAVWIAERRWAARGHDPAEIASMALWIVGAGIVGARVYHLFTGYRWSDGGFWGTFAIWKGGLSIWGAVLGGTIAVVVLARVKHLDVLALMDAIGPSVAVAQACGRWGNYFNQELFGRPSTLPWAIEIDPVHRPLGYEQYSTFQPTFLYESIWCLVVFGLIVLLERRTRLRKGQAFAAYLVLYPFGRFFFENMRTDQASVILGLRLNAWVSLLVMAFGAGWFVWLGRKGSSYSDGFPIRTLPANWRRANGTGTSVPQTEGGAMSQSGAEAEAEAEAEPEADEASA